MWLFYHHWPVSVTKPWLWCNIYFKVCWKSSVKLSSTEGTKNENLLQANEQFLSIFIERKLLDNKLFLKKYYLFQIIFCEEFRTNIKFRKARYLFIELLTINNFFQLYVVTHFITIQQTRLKEKPLVKIILVLKQKGMQKDSSVLLLFPHQNENIKTIFLPWKLAVIRRMPHMTKKPSNYY